MRWTFLPRRRLSKIDGRHERLVRNPTACGTWSAHSSRRGHATSCAAMRQGHLTRHITTEPQTLFAGFGHAGRERLKDLLQQDAGNRAAAVCDALPEPPAHRCGRYFDRLVRYAVSKTTSVREAPALQRPSRSTPYAASRSATSASPGTRSTGPSVASVGAARKIREAATQMSAVVTALIFATVSAVGITRPNTCH